MSISRQRIEDIARVYDIPARTGGPLSRVTTYTIRDQAIRVRYDVAGNVYAAWHDRADGSSRAVRGGVASVVSLMVELAEAGPTPEPEAPASAPGRGVDAFDEIERSDQAAADLEAGRLPRSLAGVAQCGDNVTHQGHWVANSDRERDGAFTWCAGETTYAEPDPRIKPALLARSWTERVPSRRELEAEQGMPKAPPAYAETTQPALVSVDVYGPADAPVYELARWDEAEAAHVHVVSLTRQEAADLIYNLSQAFSRTND